MTARSMIAAFFISLGFVTSSNTAIADYTTQAKERAVIEYCLNEYKRLKDIPGMSVGALRLAYDTCEMMKNDFKKKWGRAP